MTNKFRRNGSAVNAADEGRARAYFPDDLRCARRIELFHAADHGELEGIVAKRADSPYRRGRSKEWLKVKTKHGRAIDEERAKWNER